ncbi:MAG: fibronectin type III domain-containing protein, partial [Candidatus Gracilibacteria bacterium]
MKKVVSTIVGSVLLMAMTALPAYAADTTVPSDVENVQAEALNATVSLAWDAATDNTAVTGYQVYYGLTSVTETGQSYDEHVDVGNVLEYTVDELTNDTTYYFSVIAYDAAGNESASWAKE